MPDITIASTTDDQAEVNAAAGLPAEGKKPENEEEQTEVAEQGTESEPGSESGEEEAAGEENEGEENEGEEEGEEGERPRPKSGVQKRIDKLTKRAYQLEAEKDAERKRNDDLQRRLDGIEANMAGKKPEAAKPAVSARPKQDDFDTLDEWVEAVADWKLDQSKQKEQAKTLETKQEAAFKAYNDGAASFEAEHDDYHEVVTNPDIQVPKAVQVAIIGLGDKGAEVAYLLGKNPDVCKSLIEALEDGGDAMALVEFGAWLGTVKPKEDTPGKKTAAPNKKPVVAAPKPIKPLAAANNRSSVPLDELPYQDYKKAREGQKARR